MESVSTSVKEIVMSSAIVELIESLPERLRCGPNECLVCDCTNANWLNDLQDGLEDAAVPVLKFCDTSTERTGKLFMVGRRESLRLKGERQCLHLSNIVDVLNQLRRVVI